MLRSVILVLALGMSALTTAEAFAIGRDLPKDVLAEQGPNCVHGFMVNWTDTIFFQGETEAFNKFIENYSKRNDLERRVIIHVGTKKARSPWDSADRDIPADWSYYIWNTGTLTPGELAPGAKPAPSQVDVWLGSRIKLEDLRIPENVEVTSAGEIESFINKRLKK